MDLGMLREEPKIDLILTDVVLPGDMDGYALAPAINKDRPHTKITMTSGFRGGDLRIPSSPRAYRCSANLTRSSIGARCIG